MRLRGALFQLLVALHLMMGIIVCQECIVPLSATGEGTCFGNHRLQLTWFGRLGNNLLQLAHVLRLAQLTKSEVIVQEHEFFNQTRWDFRKRHVFSCQNTVTNNFFYSNCCPSVLGVRAFPVWVKRDLLQAYVLPAFQVEAWRMTKTVIIHVRGGDVFGVGPPGVYVQPPIAFYQAVLSLPQYEGYRIVLCAEDRSNPVIDILRRQFKTRLELITNLQKSVAAIIGAQHLVLGHSSFSEMLSLMAPDLVSVYFPFCTIRESLYPDLRATGWGVSAICYEYDNYISVGEWQNTPEQIQLMVNFSMGDVHAVELP